MVSENFTVLTGQINNKNYFAVLNSRFLYGDLLLASHILFKVISHKNT